MLHIIKSVEQQDKADIPLVNHLPDVARRGHIHTEHRRKGGDNKRKKQENSIIFHLPSALDTRRNLTFVTPEENIPLMIFLSAISNFLPSMLRVFPCLYKPTLHVKESFPNCLNMAQNSRKSSLKSSSVCCLDMVSTEYPSQVVGNAPIDTVGIIPRRMPALEALVQTENCFPDIRSIPCIRHTDRKRKDCQTTPLTGIGNGQVAIFLLNDSKNNLKAHSNEYEIMLENQIVYIFPPKFIRNRASFTIFP